MRLVTCATTAALLLLLTGCSSGAASPQSSGGSAQGTPRAAAVGPLEKYLAGGGSGTEQDRDARQRRYDGVIAACMKEAGFDYKVSDPSATDYSAQFQRLDAALTDEAQLARAARDGYFITTYRPPQYVDPNAVSVAAMSDGQRRAFYAALDGADRAQRAPDAPIDPVRDGCRGKAEVETNGSDALKTPAFASLQQDIDSFYEAQAKSPQVLALVAEWADCMADKGYPRYKTLADAPEDIRRQQAALSPTDQAAQAKMTKTEITTATADAECQRDVKYLATSQRLRFTAEQGFVKDHRTELDAMAEAAGGGS